MSEDTEKPQLPVETKSVFKLTKATTNVSEKVIAELKATNKDLPKEYTPENLVIWTKTRKDVRDIRGDAKKYVKQLKDDIKSLTKQVDVDWEKLEPILKEIESFPDKLIKEHETMLKDKREEKKKEKAEKAAAIKKIDDEVQALGNIPVQFIKSTSKEVKAEIDRLENLELTEDVFSDRVEDAEFKRELSVENLQELFDAAVEKEVAAAELEKRKKELTEQKRKDKEIAEAKAKELKKEEDEKKRISDIKDLIKVFDEFIVESATLTTSEELKAKITYVESLSTSKDIYSEFDGDAENKKQGVLKTICALMDGKFLIDRAAETA